MTDGATPLRIGVLTDGDDIPAWLAAALVEVQARGIGRVELVVERAGAEGAAPGRGRIARWWANREVLGFALAQRLDRRRSPPAPDGGSLQALAPRARRMVVRPAEGRFTDTLTADDVAAIRAADLDVLIRAGFRILKGGVLDAARHGVWSFHHGDNRTNRGGPAGVWEVLEDRDVTGVTLQALTGELDGGHVLARSVGRTQRFSFSRNIAAMYPRSTRMLVRSLERLHAGRDPMQATGERGTWVGYTRQLYRMPRTRVLRRALGKLGRRYTRRRIAFAGKRYTWSIAWHLDPRARGSSPHPVFHRYRELRSPADRFWADPFAVRDGERWWMFFEELEYRNPVGRILVVEMDRDGPVAAPRVALELEHHLSYPFVFRHEGCWYMLPECVASGRLTLWRAERFPDQWVEDRVLIEPFNGVDATLHHHTDGRWYLFTSIADAGISYDEELHLFVAPSPFGPFTPHPENPVVADVRRARMAGRLFREGERLYRPAQCCVPTYGSAVALHEVEELGPDTYRERLVQELHPDWSPAHVGLHTLNADDGLSVIDLLRADRIRA